MARLFISYRRNEMDTAFAVRQWLIDQRGWAPADIFVDLDHLRAGVDWADKLFAEAEACQAMLFLATEGALEPDSFCYRELRRSGGPIIAVTLGALEPNDKRLRMAIPHEALSRQITALDQQPTDGFNFIRLTDQSPGTVALNRTQMESLHEVLRSLGVAPNSFEWTRNDAGPYPGLRPLQEGDEALFHGRELEIRDGLRKIEELKASVNTRALIIQAPSGAGKSSFLRAGLWRRLRQHHGFTPLGIVRAAKGVVHNETWGLITGLFDPAANHLGLSRGEIVARVRDDLPDLLADIAAKTAFDDVRDGERITTQRTLLIGLDQAEEIARPRLSDPEGAELATLLAVVAARQNDFDLRLILTARDDSIDATRDRLAEAGIALEAIDNFRLNRMPAARFRDIITGPAEAAQRADWPLSIDRGLDTALAEAAGRNTGDVGDALPILALALQRMIANHRRPSDGTITLAPDDAVQFLDDAVQKAATAALATANANVEHLRRLIIPQLADWEARAGVDGAARRQVANASELFAGDRNTLRSVAQALVDQHLLTTSETLSTGEAPGDTAYEVAHEALLRVPPLGQLIYEQRDTYIQVQMLRTEAVDWQRSDRNDDRLARRGGRLTEAQMLLEDDDFGAALAKGDVPVAAYLDACTTVDKTERDREHRLRKTEVLAAKEREEAATLVAAAASKTARRTIAGMMVAVLLALVAGGTGMWALQERKTAETQRADALRLAEEKSRETARADKHAHASRAARNIADERLKIAQVTQSRFLADLSQQQTKGGDAGTGMLLGVTALSDKTVGPYSDPIRIRPIVPEAARATNFANFERRELILLDGNTSIVNSVAFNPDGQRIVTGSDDAIARLWNTKGERLALLKGHKKSITSVAFSPDGKRIVTSSQDSTVRIWNVEGITLKVLHGHEKSVSKVVFSETGQQVVTISDDATARLWDIDGKLVAMLRGHEDVITDVAFSPDGQRIATSSLDGTARLWDTEGSTLAVLKGHASAVQSISFSSDGGYVISGSDDMTARLWDHKGNAVSELTGHENSVKSTSLSPNAQLIITGSDDATARLWDTKGKLLSVLKGHTRAIRSAEFTQDGDRIVTVSDDATVRLWSADGTALAVLKGHGKPVTSVAFSPDSQLIVTGSDDTTTRLWSANGITIPMLKGHGGSVWSTEFSRNGQRLVTGSDDATARLWDIDGKLLTVLRGHKSGVWSATFSSDGQRILTGSFDGTARLWSANGLPLAVLTGHNAPVTSAAFNPSGQRIVTGSFDNTARLWDTSGKTLAVLKGHTSNVWSATFSPNGQLIVTGSDDATARVWDSFGAPVASLKGHGDHVTSTAFSSDSQRIVTASDDTTARVWDVEGNLITILKGHDNSVTSAAFSPNGQRIITSSRDNTARVWDTDGNLLAILEGHVSIVWSAAFSPDGQSVITGSDDTTARIWPVFTRTQALVDHVKQVAPRCLTTAQRRKYFLPPKPPRWCITGPGFEATTDAAKWQPKWPYHTAKWRDWLVAKDAGNNPPLPKE